MSSNKLKRNLRSLDSYAKQIAEAKKLEVKVGLPQGGRSSAVYPGTGLSVLEVGAINEFGAVLPNGAVIPERSFLRSTVNRQKKKISTFINREFENVFQGKNTTKRALGRTGALVREFILDTFNTDNNGQWAPLAPMTTAKKGSAKILVDTGTLKNSITWVVAKGKSK